MSILRVDRYAMSWNPKTKTGSIRVVLDNGKERPIPTLNADEFCALAMVLNESPVSVNIETGDIYTATWEPTGGT